MSKLVIIIPDAICVARNYKELRKTLVDNYSVSVVSLPQKVFIATTCKTSVLYLSIKQKQEKFILASQWIAINN